MGLFSKKATKPAPRARQTQKARPKPRPRPRATARPAKSATKTTARPTAKTQPRVMKGIFIGTSGQMYAYDSKKGWKVLTKKALDLAVDSVFKK